MAKDVERIAAVQRPADEILVALDECARSALREMMTQGAKAVNGAAATAVSLLTDKTYYRSLKSSFSRPESWVSQLDVGEPSDLNEVVLSRDQGRQPQMRRGSSSSKSLHRVPSKNFNAAEEAVKVQASSQRRGWGQDAQLYLELLIARFFLFLRTIVQMCVSLATFRAARRRKESATSEREEQEIEAEVAKESAMPAKGATQPLSVLVHLLFGEDAAMRDEARTTEDFIRAAGYPYECMSVTTGDGYIVRVRRLFFNKAFS